MDNNTIADFIREQKVAFICSVDEEGFPNVKAMLKPRKTDGIRQFYFSTNTSSMRVKQYMDRPAYCQQRCQQLISTNFVPLMKKLGIEGKVSYSCRHTFADLLKKVYGSDTDKAELIGHADASMTKYYQSADYASMKAITDEL